LGFSKNVFKRYGGVVVAIRLKSKGSFKKTYQFLNKASDLEIENVFQKYAQRGVNALAAATPYESGKTAASWDYRITTGNSGTKIEYINTNINKGVNIAIILQYGHGTGTGGYVEGRDYINPAIRPVFDDIVRDLWREVSSK
jgi:hypothetical protein